MDVRFVLGFTGVGFIDDFPLVRQTTKANIIVILALL